MDVDHVEAGADGVRIPFSSGTGLELVDNVLLDHAAAEQ